MTFSAAALAERLRKHGLTLVSSEVLIPEITKVLLAHANQQSATSST